MVELNLMSKRTEQTKSDYKSATQFKHTVNYITNIPITVPYSKVWNYLFNTDRLKIMGFEIVGYGHNSNDVPRYKTLTYDGNKITLNANGVMGVYDITFETYLDTDIQYSFADDVE